MLKRVQSGMFGVFTSGPASLIGGLGGAVDELLELDCGCGGGISPAVRSGFPRSATASSNDSGGRCCGVHAVSISTVFAPEDGCDFALARGCRGYAPCLGGGSLV